MPVDIQIEAGKLYFPNLPQNHPIRTYVAEEKLDMHGQDKLCRLITGCIEQFLRELGPALVDDFQEVADARPGSFREEVEEPAILILEENPHDDVHFEPLVGPDGETLI